ncbi:hypothetical protein GCM10023190_14280 [Enteractinococcus fodinae]
MRWEVLLVGNHKHGGFLRDIQLRLRTELSNFDDEIIAIHTMEVTGDHHMVTVQGMLGMCLTVGCGEIADPNEASSRNW